MNLILMRHGEAGKASEDACRALTNRGIEESKEAARRLAAKNVCPETILHSGIARAKQTAEIAAEIFKLKTGPAEMFDLTPDSSIVPLMERLEIQQIEKPDSTLMIVGHLPYLGVLCEALADSSVSFRTSTAVWIEGKGDRAWAVKEIIHTA